MFQKAYGLFAENLETKEVLGYVEHSFSMGWSKTHVRAWWKHGDADRQLQYMLIAKEDKNQRFFIARISGKSNIKVDLSRGNDKFSIRNKRFTKV